MMLSLTHTGGGRRRIGVTSCRRRRRRLRRRRSRRPKSRCSTTRTTVGSRTTFPSRPSRSHRSPGEDERVERRRTVIPARCAELFGVETVERAGPLLRAAEDDRVGQVLREDVVMLGEALPQSLVTLVEQAPESTDPRQHRAALRRAGRHVARAREQGDRGDDERERDQPERRRQATIAVTPIPMSIASRPSPIQAPAYGRGGCGTNPARPRRRTSRW